MNTSSHSIILHDIRSSQNVGAIFRTADAVGISKIYLSGYTPTPIDRFGRKRKDVAKSALGAEETVLWESVPDIFELLEKLQAENVQLVAVEQFEQSVDYKTINVDSPTAFLFGNEVTGLPADVLQKVDLVAEIPMHGTKESLNVSVSVGIALFRILQNS